MTIEQQLKAIILQEIKNAGGNVSTVLNEDTILIDAGLDSLGFTTLMVTMKQQSGLDPFGAADQITYAETFGELVSLYKEEESRNDQ